MIKILFKTILFCIMFVTNVFAADTREFKIVSLNPSLTEMLFELELGSSLVGTTEFSDFPDDAKKIPRVGTYLQPSVEKIIALKPTHILTSPEGQDLYSKRLNSAGLKLQYIQLRSLTDYTRALSLLGELFDVQDKARKVKNDWERQWNQIQPITENTVLIQVDHDPIIVAGGDSFLTEAFQKCGLKNSFAHLKGYPRINNETLVRKYSDVFVTMHDQTEKKITDLKNYWARQSQKPKVHILDPNDVSRLSLRLPAAIQNACKRVKE